MAPPIFHKLWRKYGHQPVYLIGFILVVVGLFYIFSNSFLFWLFLLIGAGFLLLGGGMHWIRRKAGILNSTDMEAAPISTYEDAPTPTPFGNQTPSYGTTGYNYSQQAFQESPQQPTTYNTPYNPPGHKVWKWTEKVSYVELLRISWFIISLLGPRFLAWRMYAVV